MPDLVIFGQAIVAAAAASIVAAAVFWFAARPFAEKLRPGLVIALAIGAGLVAGYWLLTLRLQWPPVNALDRLLTLVLPLAVAIEALAGVKRVPRWLAWIFRLLLAAAMPRVLLHGSIYVTGADEDWPLLASLLLWILSAGLLAGVWGLLGLLNRQSASVGAALSLPMAILSGGMTIMMSGYINGGAASLPMIAAILATVVVVLVLTRWVLRSALWDGDAAIGIGVVGLFGLLFIGRFFGELSTANTLVILLSPLLCWVGRLPKLRDQQTWMIVVVQVVLVAIPLFVVVVLAKQQFDREMAPLLMQRSDRQIERF